MDCIKMGATSALMPSNQSLEDSTAKHDRGGWGLMEIDRIVRSQSATSEMLRNLTVVM